MNEIKEIYSSYHYSILLENNKIIKLPKTDIGLQRIEKLKTILSDLEHQNLDKPIIENGELISDFYPHSLENHNFDDIKLIKIFIDLCDSLQYLHDKNIFNLDLKPEHIRFDTDYNLKIIDYLEGHTICPRWNAPELIFKQSFTKSCDIYSFGNLMYYSVHKTLPFETQNAMKFFYALAKERPKSDSVFSNIILKCLEKNSIDRFGSFYEIKTTLEALLQALI